MVILWLLATSIFLALPQNVNASQSNQAGPTSTQTVKPPTLTPTPTLTFPPLIEGQLTGLWSTPADLAEGVTTNWRAYPIGLCDQYQNLHLFWADNQGENSAEEDGVNAAFYYRTDSQGTLSPPKDVLVTGDHFIHFPALALSKVDNTFHLIWVNTPNGTLYYTSVPMAMASNAKAWGPITPIDTQVLNGAILADKKGTVHLFYGRRADEDGIENELMHTWLDLGSHDWASPEILYTRTYSQPSQFRVEATLDGAGRIHVGLTIRSIEYGKASEVGYLRSPDGGTTWDPYIMIEETGKTFQGVEWIAPYAFGEDEIHLTWHDPERMHIYSYDGGKTWSKPSVIIRLGGAFGGSNDLIKDSAGVLHVITAVQGGVYTSAWIDKKWSTPELIDDRQVDAHGQRIIVCQGDVLHVLYYDRTGNKTSWYSTRKITAPEIAQQIIPTLETTATETAAYNIEVTQEVAGTPTRPYIDLATINKAPTRPESPMVPILIPALIAAGVFVLFAGVVQFVRTRS